MDIPVDSICRFESEMLEFMASRHPEVLAGIREKKDIAPDLRKSLADAITEFKGFFKAE
jgi:F-type H+-transporting ATPase subunit alpha